MPLHEYKCTQCGYRFEELLKADQSFDTLSCKKCGFPADKQVSRFASVIAGGSPVEPVDMSIGREAEKRWQSYHDRQSKRRGDLELQDVQLPKSQDGKYMPVMGLGDQSERQQRQNYVGALQEHRKERVEKNQGQFDGPGEI